METELKIELKRVPKTYWRVVNKDNHTLGVFDTKEEAFGFKARCDEKCKVQEIERWERVIDV